MRFLLYLFTGAYAVATILLHVEVTRLFVGKYKHILGDFVPRQHSVEGSLLLLLAVLIFLGVRARRGTRRKTTSAYLLLYTLVLALFYRFISLHPVEVIHLLQYSVLTCLLGLCLDAQRAEFRFGKILFLGSIIGILDEVMQFYVVAPGGKYLDFGDFLVNALGVIAGLLLFYGFHRAPAWEEKPLGSIFRTVEFRGTVLVMAAFCALWWLGYVQLSPPDKLDLGAIAVIGGHKVVFLERWPGYLGTWLPHFVAGEYYALMPLEGMSLILAVCLLFATFDPRFGRMLAVSFGREKKRAQNE